jgi:hypothetical protein
MEYAPMPEVQLYTSNTSQSDSVTSPISQLIKVFIYWNAPYQDLKNYSNRLDILKSSKNLSALIRKVMSEFGSIRICRRTTPMDLMKIHLSIKILIEKWLVKLSHLSNKIPHIHSKVNKIMDNNPLMYYHSHVSSKTWT